MKHLLRAAMVLLLTAGFAHAAAIAENDQFQGQFDGGVADSIPSVTGNTYGQIGGAAGAQLGFGYSAAEAGDQAYEYQGQLQQNNNGVLYDDGAGNFSGSYWNTTQGQISGSAVGYFVGGPGIAGSFQGQAMLGGSAGVTDGGTVGVAGSAGGAAALGGSAALGDAAAGQLQVQYYEGGYEQQSVNPNGQSYVYQTGNQTFGTIQGSGAAVAGAGISGAYVVQGGGTAVQNNGQATYMEGHGSAAGEAGAGSAAVGAGVAGAAAYGTQVHSYTQEAATGTSYQGQTGTVSTTVFAGSGSVGTFPTQLPN